MEYLKVIAFTHQQIDLKTLGKLVICEQSLNSRLSNLRETLNIHEIFYVATCNRVEFVFTSKEETDNKFTHRFLETLNLGLPAEFMERFLEHVRVFQGMDAFNHLLRTSCSLESLVVGEKEILAQVRKAYEQCRAEGFTGDFLRVVMARVVKTAKEVYTETKISRNPVSVVSLAYRKLRELNKCTNSRLLIIGAGETNRLLAEYLKKHKFSNFSIFNRTFEKAESLSKMLNGTAYNLSDLESYDKGFDVLISCTGSTEHIITPKIYTQLLNGETDKKVVVDLALPTDISPEVVSTNAIHYIEIESLKETARKNIQERYDELVHAEKIIADNIQEFELVLKQRRIELAMSDVPQKIKEIKHTAVNAVFADEISTLDENSKEILEKVLNYMEKKCISVPMRIAKDILVNNR